MTRLNKLVLRGFKSFKKETVLPFRGNGLTGIVGENGSGKSNIVDALTFVMGQRSSKLRAERLSQLIYNGGERGKGADFAKVQLYMDNEDGLFDRYIGEHLGNGHRPDVISIGRKVTRNSASYKFMDKNCSRSLIEEILSEVNMETDKHQVVNQGKVTEIVNLGPQARREIVDELAGISRYEKQKEEAIEDLREVKEKLTTNRVVLGERRGQLRRLEKEREAALKYKEKEETLDLVKDSIIHRKRENIEEQLSNYQEKYEAVSEKLKEVKSDLSSLDRKAEKKERKLKKLKEDRDQGDDEELRDEVEDLKMKLVKGREELRSKEKELDNLEETIRELKEIRSKSNSSSGLGKGKPKSVRSLLERDRGGIYGTVGDLMESEDRHRVAIEVAAGGHLNDLVVDSRSTAIESVEYLKDKNLGRARFLPLMRLSGGRKSSASKKALSLNGVIDYAIELVDFDSKYRRAFEYVFRDTLVAKDLESVESAENVRVVTLDGDVLSRGGAITGGGNKGKRKSGSRNSSGGLGEKIKSKKERAQKLKGEISNLREKLDRLREEFESKEEEMENRSQVDRELKEEIEELESELTKLKSRQKDKYRRRERTKDKKNDYEKEIDGLKRDLDMLGEPSSPKGDYIDKPVKELVRRKRSLQRELDRLQPVNMKAIEEYAKQKESVEELEEKRSLLQEEKREVERLIGKIEERKKKQFQETLNELSDNFKRIFRNLFDGGEAQLKLERQGDLSSGLLIKAHPPGKELEVLDSLSGGEKSLTAIAFIFALQELQPSPFYIMDEIDAALDQRRSHKLGELLEDYAQEAQIIIISHNEETARYADRVFGVSMKEGQSEVLSLQLN